MSPGDRKRDPLLGLGIVVGNRAGFDVMGHDRHIEHHPGARTDRQERRIAGRAFLAQAGQHDRHHLLDPLQHRQERRVEPSRCVVVGRTGKFIIEAEGVEERPQPRIVMRAETGMRPERIRHLGQRLAEILGQHLLVRHVVRYLAQAVHVVGERQQPGLDLVLSQYAERVTHHRGARDLTEGTDMRQA
jgi:hypothetical protein